MDKTMSANLTKIFSGLIISLMFISLLYGPVCNAQIKNENEKTDYFQSSGETKYWALLFAVGEYFLNPRENRPSMLEAVDDLHDVLLSSGQWEEDHIHVVKGRQATGVRLIRELIWLILNEGKNDISLIYLTTHGTPLKNQNGKLMDLPPKDEDDGADEILIMYHGFEFPLSFISDDMLNFFLSLLQSKGVCLIVDSCFSGGFNDPPFLDDTIKEYSAESFTNGFVEDVATQGRVVLMSSEEDTVSWGSYFTFHLIDGFGGNADLNGNLDGINSAEEAFYYAKPKTEESTHGRQHPTILDLYDGELPITYT
jgi:hypothetical protein